MYVCTLWEEVKRRQRGTRCVRKRWDLLNIRKSAMMVLARQRWEWTLRRKICVLWIVLESVTPCTLGHGTYRTWSMKMCLMSFWANASNVCNKLHCDFCYHSDYLPVVTRILIKKLCVCVCVCVCCTPWMSDSVSSCFSHSIWTGPLNITLPRRLDTFVCHCCQRSHTARVCTWCYLAAKVIIISCWVCVGVHRVGWWWKGVMGRRNSY